MILAHQLAHLSLFLRWGMVVELFPAMGPIVLYPFKLVAAHLPVFGPISVCLLAFPPFLFKVLAFPFKPLSYPF